MFRAVRRQRTAQVSTRLIHRVYTKTQSKVVVDRDDLNSLGKQQKSSGMGRNFLRKNQDSTVPLHANQQLVTPLFWMSTRLDVEILSRYHFTFESLNRSHRLSTKPRHFPGEESLKYLLCHPHFTHHTWWEATWKQPSPEVPQV